jgi:glycosyltransferase involved in cell wall biosynthesis
MKSIYLLEPFLTGSHQRWAEGLARYSRHRIKIIGRPGRYWKWRMHGAAVTMATEINQLPPPDLILATDMLDVATFRALCRHEVPLAVYFHENQLTYPWSPTDEDVSLGRDRHYGWINYTSALAADALAFNSQYHQQSFIGALPGFLKAFPDDVDLEMIKTIEQKSTVIPLGVDLPDLSPKPVDPGPPILLWNHRWEYDKAPEVFFRLCRFLRSKGTNFRLIVLGEHTQRYPRVFQVARGEFTNEIIHWGYAKDRANYWSLLQMADILPVSSRQDFFGISAIEGIHAGSWPLLPNRLAFPEHLPSGYQHHLYRDDEELFERCHELISRGPLPSTEVLQDSIRAYRWDRMISRYDAWLEDMDCRNYLP